MLYPCSHFYFDIKFGDRFYSKENRPGSPLLFWIKSVAKFDIKVKVTTWIGHKSLDQINLGQWLIKDPSISHLNLCWPGNSKVSAFNIMDYSFNWKFKLLHTSYHQNKDKPKTWRPTINSVELRIYLKHSSQLLSLISPQHESRNA